MSFGVVLGDLRDELAALWGAGLATPGPGRSDALRSLGETMASAGLSRTAEALEEIALRLDRVVAGEASREVLEDLHDRIQRLTAWEIQFRRAWSLRARRSELRAPADGRVEDAPPRPPGLDGTIVPSGITELDGRVLYLARIEGSGEPVVLHEEWPGEWGPDPLRRAQASRLFQRPVVPLDALGVKWRLDGQPAVKRRGRWTAGPSFFSQPALLDEPVPREPMPETLTLRPTADGLAIAREDEDDAVEVVRTDALEFNLRKQIVYGRTLDVRLAPTADRSTIVAMADARGRPCFPTLDPAAVVWPRAWLDRVPQAHAGVRALVDVLRGEARGSRAPATFGEAVAGLLAGEPGMPAPHAAEAALALAAADALPPAVAESFAVTQLPASPTGSDIVRRVIGLSDPGDRRALVEAHATELGRAVRRGGVVPAGRELWLLAALLSRFDPDARLPIGLERLRLAAVNPLSRAMLGGVVSPAELEDALAIIVGWGEGARFFERQSERRRDLVVAGM